MHHNNKTCLIITWLTCMLTEIPKVLPVVFTNTKASITAEPMVWLILVGVAISWLNRDSPPFESSNVTPCGIWHGSRTTATLSNWLLITSDAWHVTWVHMSSRTHAESKRGFMLLASCSSPAHVFELGAVYVKSLRLSTTALAAAI